ncbi:hypothetical protein F511_46540 [Dorcoceras hygrometricum]|uniref:Uncharacterized protein n=1 Tax=Dorcoceras hygrometricum TaxID=472368 RepID=A0A2Z6ZTA0_9LAMI|nr:hypothetical protein F511_46540 [Dorcoceras hygrometricum]
MRGGADAGAKTCCFDSEIKTLDTIQANHIDQIRENLGSDTTVGDPDPPPGQAAEEQKFRLRQSGPRPDSRLLRQTALEVLTRSARSDSPRKTRPERNSGEVGRRRRRTAAAAAAAVEREGEGGG